MAEDYTLFPVCDGRDLEAELQCVTERLLNQNGPAPISDRAVAYAVNIEYDRIRDALMEEREVWQRWQFIYWQRKYHSYLAVLQRLDDSLKERYLDRMQQEFRRAMQTGQLDRSLFDDAGWKEICTMISRSDGASGMIRGIPVVQMLSPYIPKGIRRALLNLANRIVKAKGKNQTAGRK